MSLEEVRENGVTLCGAWPAWEREQVVEKPGVDRQEELRGSEERTIMTLGSILVLLILSRTLPGAS